MIGNLDSNAARRAALVCACAAAPLLAQAQPAQRPEEIIVTSSIVPVWPMSSSYDRTSDMYGDMCSQPTPDT